MYDEFLKMHPQVENKNYEMITTMLMIFAFKVISGIMGLIRLFVLHLQWNFLNFLF